MANIPLRAYEKKIEELIEQNHLPEAVAHCKHILKFFPKNISTYRILGKAFLEAKQYNETGDIFKRVLTVFPDDFISHVGMSIIRENENNLDAAIWHMELAFDSQPSNIAIQEELKRLFGRRDGTHPTKIRLTRGALVRMYARGELYQQAIAEINSALTEDIKRLDLEVFLAKMYFLSGDQSSAIDLCQKLSKEIPYCFEVNKILFDTSSSTQSDKNNIYTNRLQELDPYYGFVNPKFPVVEDVPDDKVLVDELSDVSLVEATKDASWISKLDNSWDKPSFVPEPGNNVVMPQIPVIEGNPGSSFAESDIFNEDKEPSLESIFEKKNEETQPIESTQPNDWLPDLNAAGSMPSTEEKQEPDGAQPAEVPDWLRSLVPEESKSDLPIQPLSDSTQAFSELENSGNLDDTLASTLGSALNNGPSSSLGSTFDVSTSQGEDTLNEAPNNADLPDWLKNFDTDKSSEPVSQDDLPNWLNTLQTPDASPAKVEPAAPAFEIPEESLESTVSAAAIFDELDEPKVLSAEIPAPESEISSLSSDNLEPSKDLVEGMEQQASSEPSENDVPDWIRKLHDTPNENQASTLDVEPETEVIMEPELIINSSTPVETEAIGPDQTISDQTSDELLEWLRDLKPEDSELLPGDGEVAQEGEGKTDGLAYDFDAELNKLGQLSQSESQEITADQPVEEILPSASDDTDDFLNRLDVVQTNPEPTVEFEISQPETSFDKSIEEKPYSPLDDLLASASFSSEGTISPSETVPNEVPEQIKSIPVDALNATNDDIEQLLAATQNKPDDHYSWQRLGDAYAGVGRYTDALYAYSKAEQILIKLS